MKLKSMIFLGLSVAISLIGATTRIHDSAHSIGTLSLNGGKVNHPAILDAGKSRYTIIATGTVLPPYYGDVKVTLEGKSLPVYRIFDSHPAIDLGFYRHPKFDNNTLYDLRPKDKIALWIVMTPKSNTDKTTMKGVVPGETPEQMSCCETPAPLFSSTTAEGADTRERKSLQRLAIVFSDTRTQKQVLRIPVIFKEKGGNNDGH